MQEVIFNGQEGKLGGRLLTGSDSKAPAALLLSPHPKYGTMNNKLLYRAFYTFADEGLSVLRFNYRGIGRSQGVFDEDDKSATMDAAAALDYLQDRVPSASSYWILGLSFGAWIGMRLLIRRPEVGAFVAISPLTNVYDFASISPCPGEICILHGTEDKSVPEESVYNVYESIRKQKNSSIEYIPMYGADHMFKDKLDDMSSILSECIKAREGLSQLTGKQKKDRKRNKLAA